MAFSGYNTSANKSRSTSYNYSPNQVPKNHIADGDKVFNYSEVYSSGDNETSATSTKNKVSKPTTVGVWGLNMGLSHNYTFCIPNICQINGNFNLPKKGAFLPLKSLEYRPVKLEHLKIKAGVFNDLPFFHRRSMGLINCTMHDADNSNLVHYIYSWYNICATDDYGRVPYVEDMCLKAIYTEYNHSGKRAKEYTFFVIPEGDIQTTRAYEGDSGNLTEYKFSLIIISEIQVQSGSGDWAEAGWGDGTGAIAHYEKAVASKIYNTNEGTITHREPQLADIYGKR